MPKSTEYGSHKANKAKANEHKLRILSTQINAS